MKRVFVLLFVFAMALIFTHPAAVWCDEAKISVTAEVDHAFFTIGDRVRFKVTAEHDPSIQIARIDTSETFKDFELKEDKSFKTEQGKTISEGREIVFTGYELGDYVLSPAVIYYREGAGQELKKIESNKLYVSIESVDKDGKPSDDIAGIKGVVNLSRKWVGWLIGILFGVMAAIGFYFYYTRKKQFAAAINPENQLTPQEEAYRALNRLGDSELLQRGQIKLYFAKLSEIIRRYMERRYQILALESTTDEIMSALRQRELDGKTLTLIKSHFEVCDLVKFAKFKPEPAEIIRQTKLAKEIVDITKAPELPAADEAAGANQAVSKP